ncbi:XdhC family protein [Sulfuricurvum sp.]|uniref:XdhC family protein n=1 Tax=Sulfuricurvum sp. TaxID=2025608 RepID=UPI003BAF60F6
MFAHKDFINFILQAKSDKKDIVCINVLDTEGSVYRKSGATMLVNSDGKFIGVVSGGCFEEDIVHCAKDILSKHEGKYVVHDLRMKDDSLDSWGKGVGCNGLIKLWMEPFYYNQNYGAIGIALEYALNGIRQTLIRSTQNQGIYRFSSEERKEEMFFDEEAQFFYQKINSPYRLLILGAGPGSEPLLSIANTLGWQTAICDTRTSNLTHVHSADETHLLNDCNEVHEVLERDFDAAVVMSHNFNSDAVYLQALLNSEVSYIGMMGPQKRTKSIISSFSQFSETLFMDPRLHNPIGLDLGGESPESIALSICAEIEADRNRAIPMSLREKKKVAIHAN